MSERALVALLTQAFCIKSAGLGADLITIDATQVGRPSNLPIGAFLIVILHSARWVYALDLSVAVLVLAVTAVLAAVITVLAMVRVLLLALIWYLACSQGHDVVHVIGITRIRRLELGRLDLVSLGRLLGC